MEKLLNLILENSLLYTRKVENTAITCALLLFFHLLSCTQNGAEEVKPPSFNTSIPEEITAVHAVVLKRQTFYKELISQGKVQAKAKSDIAFPIFGRIEKIFVKTGQKVKKGEVLATLNDYELEHDLALIQEEIAQSVLNIETKLISLGYTQKDTNDIAPELWNNIQVESGLPKLRLKLKMAEHKLKQSKIIAPISGVVANIEAQAGNPTSNYKKLCTIINNERLDVKFPLLEAEIGTIQQGNKVQVFPFYQPDQSFEAIMTAINPEVDENGIIDGFASIKNPANQLLDGMKVKVHIKERKPSQLVLPKSAVVDRQNRLVAFVYKEGLAHWTFVQIIHENADQYALDDSGLQPGDTVIISNSFDLTHLEPVRLDSLLSY